jgi:hypothetical protein
MAPSLIVYAGLVLALLSLIGLLWPTRRLGVGSRRRAFSLGLAAAAIAAVGFMLPAPEQRVARASSQLDDVTPAWQFNEFHSIHIRASPERVFDAVMSVTADEIRFFRTLTTIRRFGRPGPESLLNAPERTPILEVALRSGFVQLASAPPHEIVVGAVVVAPPMDASRRVAPLTPEIFRALSGRPGFALASMNFLLSPRDGGVDLSTETRVFGTSDEARRRFAAYWRVILPGSALIRRGWLRAVRARAEKAPVPGADQRLAPAQPGEFARPRTFFVG